VSNVAGKAYAINVITPMRPFTATLTSFIFSVVRCFPKIMDRLMGLSIIHFARWVVIRRGKWPDVGNGRQLLKNDYLLFCSNFNGTWDQYIDAFSAGVPSGLNLVWQGNLHFPGSVPNSPFKEYIRANQLYTDYYYNATPGAAQREVKSALRVLRVLKEMQIDHARMDPYEFAGAYRSALVEVQNQLGSRGKAPVASTDTAIAEANRRQTRERGWNFAD
jgi:hypothetical protein